jgi:hypothetical protein
MMARNQGMPMFLLLSEVYYDYGPWVAVGHLVMGIGGTMLIAQKGHGAYQIVLHLLVGIFCCGPWSLVSALVAKDKNLEQKLQSLEDATKREREWRWQQAKHQESALAPNIAVGQIRCPRCGSMNAEELVACWHCGLDLAAELPPAPPPELPKLAEVVDEPPRPAEVVRVTCRACGKKYSGLKGKIQMLKACPKCGVRPFDHRQLPAGE